MAPTQTVPAIVLGDDGPRWVGLEWWLPPRGAMARTTGYPTIHVRSGTVADKPAFRASFRARRCRVVGTSFYEWQRRGKDKQPCAVGLADEAPLALAGVWDR